MLSDNIKKLFSNQGILLIIILVICFFSYFQIIDYEFISWDDDVQITENTYVKNFNKESVSHNLNEERFTFLTLTTFSVIYQIWGNDPAPFHWLSILLHLFNVILVFQLIKQFSKNIYTIGFVVLLFALHPMRVESVAWISEMKDLLFTCFSLTALLFYLKYLKNNLKFYFFIIAGSMAVLASFSKVQGLFVPITFYLLDILYKRKFSLALILEKGILVLFIFFIFHWILLILLLIGIMIFKFISEKRKFIFSKTFKIYFASIVGVILLIFLFYYFFNQKSGLWSDLPEIRNTFSFPERFLLAGFALWFYIENLFLPISLNAVHPYPIRLSSGELPSEYYFTLIVLLFVICLSVIMILKRKKIPDLIFFGWFFFLINISMVMHFIPIEGRLVVADRYSYLAYFGLFVLIASAGEKFYFQKLKFKNSIKVIFFILICVLSILTYNRCKVWKNTKTLFTDVLQKNSNISFAHLNLASEYLRNQKPDSAMMYFNQSIKLDSLDPNAYFNRASAFIKMKKDYKAMNDFNTVLRIAKNNEHKALAYSNIGEIYRKSGKDSLAIYYYDLSIKQDSNLSVLYNNRGTYFLNKNRIDEARKDFSKAVKLNADYYEALNNLGWVLTLKGELDQALINFDRSIELNPKYSFAYDNRGYLKYVKRDNEGAIQDFNKATLLNPTLSQAYINRGRAYASIKNFKSAIDDFSFVLKSEPNNMMAITNRAYAWLYINEIKNAENDFILNTKFYPQDAIVWQNLALFHMQLKDYKNAIIEFEKSTELDKTLFYSYMNIGWIYLELKEFKKAEKYFNICLGLNPNSSETLFWLGELNRKAGNKEVSCTYYKNASTFGSVEAKNALDLYCK